MLSKKQKTSDPANQENNEDRIEVLMEPMRPVDPTKIPPRIESKNRKLLSDHLNLNTQFFREFSSQYRNKQAGKVYHTTESSQQEPLYSQILTEPFLAGTIGEVFEEKFLSKVKSEIEIHMTYNKKNNDLYEFYQSGDLKSTKLKFLKRLCEAIYSQQFVTFLSELTGVQLNSTLDASVSKYVYGNHLLCHDDDIQTTGEGRRIAFIIYLVDKNWTEADGGALELFSRDQFGHPSHSNKTSILPKWNQIAFFEIGSHSYHQVAEVLAKCKDRLSVVGWFHGPLPKHAPPPLVYPTKPFSSCEADLSDVINPDYLGSAMQKIHLKFKEDGCVELQSFIRPDIYQLLLSEIGSLNWGSPRGPAHIRNYCIASQASGTTQTVLDMLSGEKFKSFISELTGILPNHCRGELRRFNPRDYSLLNDDAIEPSGLDLTLSIVAPDSPAWDPVWGGGMHYLRGEESLFSIHPSPNCLFLIHRPKGTLRFVKYVKTQAKYPVDHMSFVYN